MAELAREEIENLTAEDMRDYMYGHIKSMIEGNAAENVSFHYFMPPIPFGPELGAFMEIGPRATAFRGQGFTVQDMMRSAVNFATIVDYVPTLSTDGENSTLSDINTLISSGVKISNVYKSILNQSRVFNNERSEEDKLQLKKFRALLFREPVEVEDISAEDATTELSDEHLLSLGDDDGDINLADIDSGINMDGLVVDPDKIAGPTKIYQLYEALQLRYNEARIAAADALRHISPNDPNASVRIVVAKRKVKAAEQLWLAQGRKLQVEAILSKIEHLSQGGMIQYLAELRERLNANEFQASIFSDPELGVGMLTESAFFTALRPNGVLSADSHLNVRLSNFTTSSWSKFKRTASGGGVKLPFSIGSASGSARKLDETRERGFFKESFSIEFDIAQGMIDRPWFAKEFVESRAYTTVDPDTQVALDPVMQLTSLSDGKTPPESGQAALIPQTVYFVRNLTIRSKALASMSELEISELNARGGVSLFGFGSHARHENKTVNTSYKREGTDGVIRADGSFLVAMSSVHMKKSPDPDFESFPRDQWI